MSGGTAENVISTLLHVVLIAVASLEGVSVCRLEDVWTMSNEKCSLNLESSHPVHVDSNDHFVNAKCCRFHLTRVGARVATCSIKGSHKESIYERQRYRYWNHSALFQPRKKDSEFQEKRSLNLSRPGPRCPPSTSFKFKSAICISVGPAIREIPGG